MITPPSPKVSIVVVVGTGREARWKKQGSLLRFRAFEDQKNIFVIAFFVQFCRVRCSSGSTVVEDVLFSTFLKDGLKARSGQPLKEFDVLHDSLAVIIEAKVKAIVVAKKRNNS